MESINYCTKLKLWIIMPIFVIVFSVLSFGKLSFEYDKENGRENKPSVTQWAFSPVALMDLAKLEVKFYKTAVKMKKELKDQLDAVDKWIDDYEASTTQESAAITITDHPLMGLRMIRRFSYDLDDILQYMSENGADRRFIRLMNNSEHPKPLDLLNTADKILMMQIIYDFTADQLIRGNIGGKPITVGLTLPQAYEIGKRGLETKIWPLALDWFHTILRLIKKKSKGSEFVDKSEVQKNIRRLIDEHDALHDSIKSGEEEFYLSNLNRFHTKIHNARKGKTILELETEKDAHVREKWELKYELPEYFSFMLLCAGENYQTNNEKSKLICYYESKSDPFWKINPLKIEVHSWDPYLIQIYDVIGDSRIKYMKTKATPRMVRSEVVNIDSNAIEIADGRTSVQTFLADPKNSLMGYLNILIGKMIGLHVVTGPDDEEPSSEFFQIAAYSFGGYFGEHLDALNLTDMFGGERIATFMIYLNDVKLGGGTAFPVIGTAISPVKGSAVFWYNLMRNGEIDERSLHGGCPVILGQKWIANKWILNNVNFQKRKCTLNPEE